MYIRSLYLKQLSGNQKGAIGLLVTCVSHHMTDMQLSGDIKRHLIETNDLGIDDAFELIDGAWEISRAVVFLFD